MLNDALPYANESAVRAAQKTRMRRKSFNEADEDYVEPVRSKSQPSSSISKLSKVKAPKSRTPLLSFPFPIFPVSAAPNDLLLPKNNSLKLISTQLLDLDDHRLQLAKAPASVELGVIQEGVKDMMNDPYRLRCIQVNESEGQSLSISCLAAINPCLLR